MKEILFVGGIADGKRMTLEDSVNTINFAPPHNQVYCSIKFNMDYVFEVFIPEDTTKNNAGEFVMRKLIAGYNSERDVDRLKTQVAELEAQVAELKAKVSELILECPQ